ncbi:MAG: YggT family protein [Methylophilus sp.]|jgi:YggT family protein
MLHNAFVFLLSTIFGLFTFALLLRFFMQLLKTSFYNPLGQMVMALTDFVVKPARRWIPSWKKIDLSTLVLAFISQLLLQLGLLAFNSFALVGNASWLYMTLLAILGLIHTSLDIFFYALILQAILSWVNPHSPISGVLYSLTRPILDPIRRILPVSNGIDFSPLVAMILLQMFNIAFVSYLESYLRSFI